MDHYWKRLKKRLSTAKAALRPSFSFAEFSDKNNEDSILVKDVTFMRMSGKTRRDHPSA